MDLRAAGGHIIEYGPDVLCSREDAGVCLGQLKLEQAIINDHRLRSVKGDYFYQTYSVSLLKLWFLEHHVQDPPLLIEVALLIQWLNQKRLVEVRKADGRAEILE